MQVIVYTNEAAPVGFQHIAHIVSEQPGKPGKPWKLGFHPVVFRAATAEGAQALADQWWADELKAVADRQTRALAASERMRKPKAEVAT